MTFLKRLRVLPIVLGVAATLAAVGSTLFGDLRTSRSAPRIDDTRSLGSLRSVSGLVTGCSGSFSS